MDPAAFSPDHDLAGKRLRSLALYGVETNVRASDGFEVALDQIVASAAHFAGTGAALVLWPGPDPVVVSRAGAFPATDLPAAVARVWARLERPAPGDTAAPTVSEDVVLAAPVVGRDGVTLGLLAVLRSEAGPAPDEARWLVAQLARAVVAALDERRRVLRGRHVPEGSFLRLTERVDRRRPPSPG